MSKYSSNLAGRVAIVTGGAQGIGAACVEALVAEGVYVGIVDINPDTLDSLAARLNQQKRDCVIAIHADVSNPSDIESAVEAVAQKWSRLDILVNNAAIFGGWKLKDIPLDGWHKVIDVNLTSTMLFSKFAYPHMAKNRVGSIINITSIASEMGDAGSAVYASTKGAIQSLTRTLAVELAPDNIRVNAVMPHAIKTPLMLNLGSYEEVEEMWKPRLPLSRLGRPECVAAVVALLAGDNADFVTGATYAVNGGITSQLNPTAPK